MTGKKTRTGLGVGLALALAGVSALQARPAKETLVPECQLTIGAERVPVQAEPVAVPVKHSEALGESITASLPEASKVKVMEIARDGNGDGQTLRLTLNTSEAVAGSYELTVRDGQKECKGTIRIGEERKDSR